MLVVVGRVGRAHGIKGEVTVEVRTDEPENRLAAGSLLLTDPAEAGPLTLVSGRVHSGRLLAHFAGVDDRAGAEALRGTLLLVDVDPEARPEDIEEYYDHQLVGLAVVGVDGSPLGEVAEVLHLPAHDVLSVTAPDGAELLVPFVTAIVPEVDLPARRLVVDPPPGLFDAAPTE